MAEKFQIEEFYRKWKGAEKDILKGYLYDEEKNSLKTRYLFSWFIELLRKFLTNNLHETEKIIVLTGLRGTGKTTLLSQIYFLEKFAMEFERVLGRNITTFVEAEKFYIDVGRLKFESIKLNEFFNFYENERGIRFEALDKKIILFLDEAQYDENWGLFLKTLFDSTKGHKNLLVIATGSSTLKLKTNPDLMRRCTFVELFPLKISEYFILKHNLYLRQNFSSEFVSVLNDAKNAGAVFNFLKSKENEIGRFWNNTPINEEEKFLYYGGFPFGITIASGQKIIDKTKELINSVITKDVPFLANIRAQMISRIDNLIFLLANSGEISIENLSGALKLNYRTTVSIIDILVKSGLIVKVPAFGKSYGQVRKSPKLLFISPSLRFSVLNGIISAENKGFLLEDYCSLVFSKEFKGCDIFYDYSKGGADFILTLKDRSRIAIEVGFNKEKVSQVENTQKKVGSKYAVVFGSKNLELVSDSIVKIPLKYLLLV